MIRQRSVNSGPSVQAVAEYLPFQDNAFDCVMAILTIHHWSDPFAGISEMKRVARERVVILSWDQEVWDQFWLLTDYLPALGEFIRHRAVVVSAIESALGSCRVLPVLIPNNCVDGFLGAFWSRPSAYLDREIRARMSAFSQVPMDEYAGGLNKLAMDLENGNWLARYGDLLESDVIDLGYRLIVYDSP
jgi:SAM-dependent methyltransferase